MSLTAPRSDRNFHTSQTFYRSCFLLSGHYFSSENVTVRPKLYASCIKYVGEPLTYPLCFQAPNLLVHGVEVHSICFRLHAVSNSQKYPLLLHSIPACTSFLRFFKISQKEEHEGAKLLEEMSISSSPETTVVGQ